MLKPCLRENMTNCNINLSAVISLLWMSILLNTSESALIYFRRRNKKHRLAMQEELQDSNQTKLFKEASESVSYDPARIHQRTSYLKLGSFDVEGYLSVQRMEKGDGRDPMKRFQFNQVASDATPPDRFLQDVRHPRSVRHSYS